MGFRNSSGLLVGTVLSIVSHAMMNWRDCIMHPRSPRSRSQRRLASRPAIAAVTQARQDTIAVASNKEELLRDLFGIPFHSQIAHVRLRLSAKTPPSAPTLLDLAHLLESRCALDYVDFELSRRGGGGPRCRTLYSVIVKNETDINSSSVNSRPHSR